MAGKMFRATKGCTAKSVVYSAAAATYGVAQATELAVLVGGNVPNRLFVGNTVWNALQKALEQFCRAKKPAAPGAGNLKCIALNTQTLGLQSPDKPTISDKAGATAVDDNAIAILVGNTLYGSIDDSALILRAFEAICNAPTMLSAKKKG